MKSQHKIQIYNIKMVHSVQKWKVESIRINSNEDEDGLVTQGVHSRSTSLLLSPVMKIHCCTLIIQIL